MNITLSANLDGLVRKFESLAAAASDPTPALLRCGGLVRAHARRVFEQQGPGWPALSPETQARKITAAEIAFLKTDHHGRSMVGAVLKLARQIRKGRLAVENARSSKSLDNATAKQFARMAEASRIADQFASRRLSSFGAMVKFAEREKARKAMHGKALMNAGRMSLGDGESYGYRKFTDRHGNEKQTRYVQDASLERRRAGATGKRRYLAQGNADRMLGNLDKSLGMHVEGHTVKVYSRARIGGIHNVGGTAGKGAKIPARPFMYIPDGASKVFAQIVVEQLTGAFLS